MSAISPALSPVRSPSSPPPLPLPPVYPHGHKEHVCPAAHPRRRRSSASSISLPVRRRESFSGISPAAARPLGSQLDTVVSGSSDLELSSAATAFTDDLDHKEKDLDLPSRVITPAEKPLANASGDGKPQAKAQGPIWLAFRRKQKLPDHERAAPTCHLEWNWARWAGENVEPAALVPALITQALSTGVLDATTYADFETFASNQTGNAILLTLSAIGTAKILLVLTAVSFGSFLGFAFLFGHLGHYVGVRRRAWLLVSVSVQTLMLVLAAIFLSPHGPKSTQLGAKHEWTVLFLFAGMSGAQVAMARQSSCQELPTAPMTSTFVDFVADHYLFAAWSDPRATPRNRRVMYVVAMIGGSFVGALMHKHATSWVVVAVSVGIKAMVLVLVSVAAAEEPSE